ncbi:unnamed protein product [Rotaria magnacalcarata]|uniref:Uncharacterized protein n=4 Tax=Rotaria magnacalcarata TaxID=392030 RepID=A0A816NX14_9BILA|nr:unnamed protein product [Rotaria magnacalcarata]CAF2113362.1 unnamed protein product [Rotaria magnacalcarata]
MFSFVNRTVFDIPLTWNRTSFEATRAKCRKARKLIEISVNVQYEKQLKYICQQNLDVEKTITETNEHLLKHEKKVHVIDNLTDMASESLPVFFDKRMEKIRSTIHEHCSIIRKVLEEENDYWKEIHFAIDQNLITSNDIHPCIQDMQTINEQNSSKLLNDEPQILMNVGHPISTKQEPMSTDLNPVNSNRVLPSINQTYVITLEETANNETNETLSMETCSHAHLIDINTSPMYSQPNPPVPLYFSPTILQDEQTESIKSVLSPLDRNMFDLVKPKLIINRVSQEVLLGYLKMKDMNDIENNHVQYQSKQIKSIHEESNIQQQNSFAFPEPISKIRSRPTIKNEPESIHTSENTKPNRKRKQSVSDDNDRTSSTITLRKRKPISYASTNDETPKQKRVKKQKTNKIKKKQEEEIPIREPSPLPTINRSMHYSTRFSTRSHRLNNFPLLVNDVESEDDNDKTEFYAPHQKRITKQNSHPSKNATKSKKR